MNEQSTAVPILLNEEALDATVTRLAGAKLLPLDKNRMMKRARIIVSTYLKVVEEQGR